ncbi:preprotein translocase subunit SecD [Actinacidiphila alni]|uniref:Preprotein translocase subunit SecD n=1 Tax=Actinacidiphila alni TaxID=380248 RepID=A0A1I2B6I2_9ACTN|nr:hypothetical protein [Actinacidiphila alni]SFE51587.1 preprotein translocase subunit SecD [Actinacidiphila alni]
MRTHRTVTAAALTLALATLAPVLAACSSSDSPADKDAVRAVDPRPSGSTASGRTVATYTPATAMSASDLATTVERLKARAAAFGLDGTRIERHGSLITADAPGDSGDRLRQLAATAELTFRAVKGDRAARPADVRQRFNALTCPATGTPPLSEPLEPMPACDSDTGRKLLLGPVVLDGEDVKSAKSDLNTGGGTDWVINLSFTDRGAQDFATVTTDLSQQTPPADQFAILLDDKILSAPTVQQAITGGEAQITGDFTRQRAENLAALISTGALPVRLTVSDVARQP